jgi:hypothetical protein
MNNEQKPVLHYDVDLRLRIAAPVGDDFEGIVNAMLVALFGKPGGFDHLVKALDLRNYGWRGFHVERVSEEQIAKERAKRERRERREAKAKAKTDPLSTERHPTKRGGAR